MSNNDGLNRRAFLRNAGIISLASAVGTHSSLAAAASGGALEQADSNLDFDTVYNRIGSDSSKWDGQIARWGEDLEVPMGVADMDFKTAPAVTRALRKRVEHEAYGYLSMPESYLESIVNWNKRRYGVEIDPDSIMHSDGVHPGIISTLRAFCPPGSKVLLHTPDYSGFYTDIRIVGCVAEESLLKLVNGRYQMDFEDLERRLDYDTHALILCNPQNPTGNSWSRQDLMTLGEICTRRRVVVLSDEIHCDFVTKGNTHVPYASLDNEEIVRNSITYKSVSKSFNLSALKCAYLFSTNADYLARVRGAGQHRQSVNTLGIVAAEAAYNEGEAWQKQLVEYIDGNLDYVESFVRSNLPLVKVVKPQGTYLSWLDVSELIDKIGAKQTAAEANRDRDPSARPVTPTQIVQRWVVDNAHVLLNAGSSYGLGGEARMRMNCAASRSLIEKALNNMATAFGNA